MLLHSCTQIHMHIMWWFTCSKDFQRTATQRDATFKMLLPTVSIRPAIWLSFLHEIALPILWSLQYNWWRLVFKNAAFGSQMLVNKTGYTLGLQMGTDRVVCLPNPTHMYTWLLYNNYQRYQHANGSRGMLATWWIMRSSLWQCASHNKLQSEFSLPPRP